MKNKLVLDEQYSQYEFLAGCDEAGRGCLLGPVVASSVILPKDFYSPLINDSKKLSEKQREEAFKIIQENAVAIGIGIIAPETIDENTGIVVEKGDKHSLYQAVETMYNETIENRINRKQRCIKRAKELFNKEKCFDRYIELFEKILQNKNNDKF